MTPPTNHPCLHLDVLGQTFSVKQYAAMDVIPFDDLRELSMFKARSGIISITRTAEEISIVREVEEDKGEWKCIKIAGPMEFGPYFSPGRVPCVLTGRYQN